MGDKQLHPARSVTKSVLDCVNRLRLDNQIYLDMFLGIALSACLNSVNQSECLNF